MHEILFDKEPSALQSYFPDDLSDQRVIEDLKREALGGSLFSRNKIVALYECDSLRAAIGDKLLPIFEIDPTNIMFVLISTQPDKQVKWLDAVRSTGLVANVQALQGPTLKRWIEKELTRQGHTGGITPEALDILANAFNEDASCLASELSKLALTLKPTETVKAADLRALILGSAEANTFELLESAAQRRTTQAFRIFDNLSEQGVHPLQILALLSKAIRSLLASRDHVRVHSELSNPWILRNLPQSQRNFSTGELRSALGLLSKLDLQLKGSKRDPEALMQDLLVALSTRSAAPNQPRSLS